MTKIETPALSLRLISFVTLLSVAPECYANHCTKITPKLQENEKYERNQNHLIISLSIPLVTIKYSLLFEKLKTN
jgi:hypothetical protein